MEGNSFKGSLFGGFKREDVIDYITKTSAASEERIAALESDVDKLTAQERDLRSQLSTANDETTRLAEELETVTIARDAARSDLAAANASLDALRTEVETLRAENEKLRKENVVLRPLAEQYTAVKSHIAGIELDARRRADDMERDTREKLAAMIDACRKHCDSALTTLDETCANVSGELRKAELAVSGMPSSFNTLRNALDELDNLK